MKTSLGLLTAVAAIAIAGSAMGHAFAAGGVTVTHPWSRPAAAGSNGAGFMGVTNTGRTPVTLVSVRTTGAASAVAHRTQAVNGVYSMAAAPNLVVKAGETVTFAPGGYHVMFMGLKAPLVVGGKLPATLIFKRGNETLTVPVTFNVQAGNVQAGAKVEHRH